MCKSCIQNSAKKFLRFLMLLKLLLQSCVRISENIQEKPHNKLYLKFYKNIL